MKGQELGLGVRFFLFYSDLLPWTHNITCLRLGQKKIRRGNARGTTSYHVVISNLILKMV